MDVKIEKLLQSLKGKKVGVFVDDSNLYHSYKKYGWRIDFRKLRTLPERYCDLKFINYHIAIPAVVHDKKKNILFVGYEENMAWELRQCWHLYVNRIKNEIVLQ